MHRKTIESIAGVAFFVAFIAANFLLGINAAVRVVGISCVVTGVVWALNRSVPVGIEGQPPSFFVRGVGAKVAGAIIFIIGTVLLVYAHQAACFLGWASEVQCS